MGSDAPIASLTRGGRTNNDETVRFAEGLVAEGDEVDDRTRDARRREPGKGGVDARDLVRARRLLRERGVSRASRVHARDATKLSEGDYEIDHDFPPVRARNG